MNNLKVLWGSDHKVGTTMLAQSYAEILAKAGNETLLLTFSTNPGDDFYEEKAYSIEQLKNRLSCGLITKENITDYALKGSNFYKVNGFFSSKNIFGFTPRMAEELMEISVETFDDVIIDCGTGLDNPLALAALEFGNNNIFIFSQQESSLRSWENFGDRMLRLGVVPKTVVINKFYKGDNYSTGYIAQRTGIPHNILRTVTECEFGIQAEADRKTLLFYGDKQYEKDVRGVMN